MVLKRIIYLLPLLLWLLVGASPAAAAESKAYKKARAGYDALLASQQKQLYRDNWVKVIDSLSAVDQAKPADSQGAQALFLVGKAWQGLWNVSRLPQDGEKAVATFDLLAQKYPESPLADDALVLAAGVLETVLNNPAQAYLRYQQAREAFPQGDMRALAEKKLAALAAHAPPKVKPAPAVAATAAPEKVSKEPRSGGGVELTGVRFWSNPGYTRVVVDLTEPVAYTINKLPADPKDKVPARLYVDLAGAVPAAGLVDSLSVNDGLLQTVRTGRPTPQTARVVLDLVSFGDAKVFLLEDPTRLVIDVAGEATPSLTAVQPELRAAAPAPLKPEPPVSSPAPAAAPDQVATIVEQAPVEPPSRIKLPKTPIKGLRRIVVDAGHGGKDPGAIGANGLMEKVVTLAMAKELAARLEEELGCEVILTRKTDIFIPLEERTAIANKVGADLFISIHANASVNRSAQGVETYYLNFSKNDKAAAVAARENGTSIKQVGDLELILFDLMANAKINESSRLASEIQKSLVGDLSRHYSNVKDLGVKQGPFYVLLGATMPSVLVEAAFISNSVEETRLQDGRFHEQTASAIVKGVRNYATALDLVATQ